MNFSLTIFSAYLLLLSTPLFSDEVSVLESKVDQLLAANSNVTLKDSNCWGTSLYLLGAKKKIEMIDQLHFKYFTENFCTGVSENNLAKGDLIVYEIQTEHGLIPYHSSFYLGEGRFFEKEGPNTNHDFKYQEMSYYKNRDIKEAESRNKLNQLLGLSSPFIGYLSTQSRFIRCSATDLDQNIPDLIKPIYDLTLEYDNHPDRGFIFFEEIKSLLTEANSRINEFLRQVTSDNIHLIKYTKPLISTQDNQLDPLGTARVQDLISVHPDKDSLAFWFSRNFSQSISDAFLSPLFLENLLDNPLAFYQYINSYTNSTSEKEALTSLWQAKENDELWIDIASYCFMGSELKKQVILSLEERLKQVSLDMEVGDLIDLECLNN